MEQQQAMLEADSSSSSDSDSDSSDSDSDSDSGSESDLSESGSSVNSVADCRQCSTSHHNLLPQEQREEEEKILNQSRGLHAGEWRESSPRSCLCKIGQMITVIMKIVKGSGSKTEIGPVGHL